MSEEMKSAWVCQRCGRAGTVSHYADDSDDTLRALAQLEHSRRQRGKGYRSIACSGGPNLLRVRRGSKNYVCFVRDLRVGSAGTGPTGGDR